MMDQGGVSDNSPLIKKFWNLDQDSMRRVLEAKVGSQLVLL